MDFVETIKRADLKKLPFAPYMVSNKGEVFSLLTGKTLRPSTDSVGYLQVSLRCENGTRRTYRVHRLVGLVWVRNLEPHKKKEINHKNGIKHDNRHTNLEWVTHAENIKHSYEKLGRKAPSGSNHWNSGKAISVEARKKMSDAKKGENHPKFKGYYWYEGEMFPSLQTLADRMGTYYQKVWRMYQKKMVDFVGLDT